MRLLLYNIRYATGHKKGFHLPLPYAGFFKKTGANLERIIHFIRLIDPDIIGLVEVDSGSYRSSNACQAAQIANDLGYHFVVETKYSDSSFIHRVPIIRQQSNALLSRNEIIDTSFHYFSQGVKRLIIKAELQQAASWWKKLRKPSASSRITLICKKKPGRNGRLPRCTTMPIREVYWNIPAR